MSFPRNAFDSSFFVVGRFRLELEYSLGHVNVSKVNILETFRDSKGINTAKRGKTSRAPVQ